MFSIVPRDQKFFDLFEEIAELLSRGAQAFVDLLSDYDHREQHLLVIRQFEHDADAVAHRTYERLDRTFITPFEREDIHSLMRRMDDVIDGIDAASKRLILYEIATPKDWLLQQADILRRATQCVQQAMPGLRTMRRPDRIRNHLMELHDLENQGDDIHHAAVAELYAGAGDPIEVMKWKEIYDLTERAIDRCEDIADVLERLLLKSA